MQVLDESNIHSKQLLDFKNPPGSPPSLNKNSGIKKDLPCSSPGCPNFCSPQCGFCDLHCEKFHNGVHYNKIIKAEIPEAVSKYLNLKPGDSLEWYRDIRNSEKVVIVSKKKPESDFIAKALQEALTDKDSFKKINR